MGTLIRNVLTDDWRILEMISITETMIQIPFEISASSNQMLGENWHFIRYVYCFDLFHRELDMRIFTFLWFLLIIWDYNYGNKTPTKTIHLKIVIKSVLNNDCYEYFFS